MKGLTNLDQLLKEMSPVLQPGTYVFCTVAGAKYGDYAELDPVAAVRESEGLTLVLTQEQARAAGFLFDGLFKMITLEVHSSLEAVGLTAAFATKLSQHNISANVIAGYFHDHIFVQAHLAERAMQALNSLPDISET